MVAHADVAMEPTRVDVKPVLNFCKQVDVHAMVTSRVVVYRVTYRVFFQNALKL